MLLVGSLLVVYSAFAVLVAWDDCRLRRRAENRLRSERLAEVLSYSYHDGWEHPSASSSFRSLVSR